MKFLCLLTLLLPWSALAATGQITFDPYQSTVVQPDSAFTLSGSYLQTSDNVPAGAFRDCGPYSQGATYSMGYWDWINGYGTYSEVYYDVDTKQKGRLGNVTWCNWPACIDYLNDQVSKRFSATISTANMAPGTTHHVTVYFQDVYGAGCVYVGGVTSWGKAYGPRFGDATFSFRIADNTPTIGIKLDKPSMPACVAETGTITVASNDPTPNGGTVTLTWPDGTSDSYSFTGSSATLSFADFGHPAGYVDGGAHAPGSVLTFAADVTTAAGYTASAAAQASVVPGGLNVTVTPARTVVEPTLPVRRQKGQNGANQTSVDITVKNSASRPVDGAKIVLSVERASSRFGGHDHDTPAVASSTRPLGSVSPAIGRGQGLYTTTYTASEFAAEDKIRAKASFQGCNGEAVSAPVISKLDGLTLLSVFAPSVAVGGRNEHHGPNDKGFPVSPDNNHWVSLGTSITMSYLMEAYYRDYGAGLYVNDGSLPFGGKFDVDGSWTIARGHSLHRRGIDVDIRLYDTANTAANETVAKNINKLVYKEKWLKKRLFGEVHGSGGDRHWHIYFW